MNYKLKCSDCKEPHYVTEVKLKYGTTAWLCELCLKKRRSDGWCV